MATNVLYVTAAGAPLASIGIKGLTINDSRARFKSTGDNTDANYKGRATVSGTVIFEQLAAALARVGVAETAAQTFTVVDGITTATKTMVNFAITNLSADYGDGTQDGDVPGVSCDWVAASVATT